MDTLWYCLVASTLTLYVVLDGYDLGAGMLQHWIGRSSLERSRVISTIGPVWDGNEVWLLAAGGTIFAVFPALYATAFSGFYLPLMLVLWLIAGRALGIEFRHGLEHPLWLRFWDLVFSVSSALLALFFGVALGNVARGVPIGPDGTFFEPLWTDFSPTRGTGILDGYTLLAGITAVAALAHHGALWVAVKTEGVLQERARSAARITGGAEAVLAAGVTLWTRSVQPHMANRFADHPWGYLFPALAAAGLASAIFLRRKGRDLGAFIGSALHLAGMMSSVAFSLYPFVLPSSLDPRQGLTASAAAADPRGLWTALVWWIPGMALASGYSAFVSWKFSGKVTSADAHY